MARLIFEGLTQKQAKVLASWFEGQGEQDCCVWFDDRNVSPPLVEVRREDGYTETLENGDVVVYCHTPNIVCCGTPKNEE